MTAATTAEIQKVNFNREYKLDLTGFDAAALSFVANEDLGLDATQARTYFEDILVARIFGLELALDTNKKVVIDTTTHRVTFVRYSSLKYNIMYAPGNGSDDTKKCIFGIVSDVIATINRGAPDKFQPDKKYMFVFAHKPAYPNADPATPEKNILRVHEIVDIPNTHFVSAKNDTAASGSTPASVNTECGLFAGSVAPTAPNTEANCILGFFAVNEETTSETKTQFFYLPINSYCLEGKSKDFIDLGTDYTGRFKVGTTYSTSV